MRTKYPKLHLAPSSFSGHTSLGRSPKTTLEIYEAQRYPCPFPHVPLSEIHRDTNTGTASAPTFLDFGACIMPNARLKTVLDRLYDTRAFPFAIPDAGRNTRP